MSDRVTDGLDSREALASKNRIIPPGSQTLLSKQYRNALTLIVKSFHAWLSSLTIL